MPRPGCSTGGSTGHDDAASNPFRKLARTITEHRVGILAAIEHGLSNARVEQVNTQIRLITRRAFGFHSAHALIALAMLTLAGLRPPPPRPRPR